MLTTMTERFRVNRSALSVFAALTGLVLIFWLPFGFKVTGLVEEWFIVGFMRTGNPLYWVDTQSVMNSHAMRPLTFFPFALAYTFTPDSFLGLNLLQCLLFMGKGMFTYLILHRLLRGQAAFAFLVAVLFVIHPADAGLFMLRAVNVHWTVMLTLAAIYLLLRWWDTRQRWLLPLMWGALAVSLLTYEVAYPLVALTPLLLVWRERRITRRVMIAAALWYAVPLLTGLYAAAVVFNTSSTALYQAQILRVGSVFDIGQIVQAAALMFWHSLISSWTTVFSHAPFPPLYWAIALGVGIGAAGVALWLVRQSVGTVFTLPLVGEGLAPPAATDAINRVPHFLGGLLYFLTGLAIILLGYLPYLFIPALRFSELRTYYLSSLGAALCLGGLIVLLTRGRQRPMIALLSIAIGIAALHGIHQVGYFADLTQRQQRFMGQLLTQAPTLAPDTTLAIIDTSGLMDTEWFFGYSQTLTSVIHYLYGTDQVSAVRCFAQSPEIVPCSFDTNGLTYRTSTKADTVGYEMLLVFEYSYDRELRLLTDLTPYTGGGSPRTYQPQPDVSSAVNPLLHSLFACWPIESCTSPVVSQLERDPLRIEFGGSAVLGRGWRSGETGPGGFDFQWSVQPESTLTVFVNDSADRELELFVRYLFPPTTAAGLRLRVNDTPVELTLTTTPDGYHYRGIIPRAAFTPAVDTIAITVDAMVIEPSTGNRLGIAADWLTIRAFES